MDRFMADDRPPRRKAIPAGRLLIDGVWRDAANGETSTTFDPTTEAAITDIAKAGVNDTGEAVAAAQRAFALPI
jgi:aldehyde dehydrogenase (NAD+)